MSLNNQHTDYDNKEKRTDFFSTYINASDSHYLTLTSNLPKDSKTLKAIEASRRQQKIL